MSSVQQGGSLKHNKKVIMILIQSTIARYRVNGILVIQ